MYQQPPQPPSWGQPQPPSFYQQPVYQQPPKKWYQKNIWIIVFLIIFFPVGLFLMWRYANWPRSIKWIITGVLALLFIFNLIVEANAPGTATTQTTPAATQQPVTQVQQSTPTQVQPTQQTVSYPPKTKDDLQKLAALGDANAVQTISKEKVGLTGVCAQDKRLVLVSPSITGKKLAEDLLAYFYSEQLTNNCGSVVFAYHNKSETGDAYTAGRVDLTVNDSSGQVNTDPNASNLTYVITLDVGGDSSGKEYVVTY